jgi:multimeric flavodoxin WrbA
MKQRVLIVAGSPRAGGNTDDAVLYLADRLRDSGRFAVETVQVRDLHIRPCAGCRVCMERGECAIQDDEMPALMATVAGCDVLILAAPVYWMGPPGAMKNFIDRTHGVFTNSRYLASKPGALVSVAADGGFEPHEAIVSSWFCYYGGDLLRRVRLLAREKGELVSRPAELQKLDRLAETLASREGE